MDVNSGVVPKLITWTSSRDFKTKFRGTIVDAPRYIRNGNLHRDLGVETAAEIIKKATASLEQRLQSYVNVKAI